MFVLRRMCVNRMKRFILMLITRMREKFRIWVVIWEREDKTPLRYKLLMCEKYSINEWRLKIVAQRPSLFVGFNHWNSILSRVKRFLRLLLGCNWSLERCTFINIGGHFNPQMDSQFTVQFRWTNSSLIAALRLLLGQHSSWPNAFIPLAWMIANRALRIYRKWQKPVTHSMCVSVRNATHRWIISIEWAEHVLNYSNE